MAANPTTVRGAAVHLGGDPKGESILYTNGRSVLIRNLKVSRGFDTSIELPSFSHFTNPRTLPFAPNILVTLLQLLALDSLLQDFTLRLVMLMEMFGSGIPLKRHRA